MIERFETMASVRAYGINRVEIVMRENNEIVRTIRTRWDDLRDFRNERRRLQIETQIERLQSELNTL